MRCRSLVAGSLLILLRCAAHAAAAGQCAMSISPTGELTLTLNGRPVATGNWHLRPDTYIPGDDPAAVGVGPVVSLAADPAHATAHERHAAVTADYTFDLRGEDLRIAAHVANADPAHAVQPIAFTGLTFHFNPAVPVTGQLSTAHWTYLQARGLDLFHPSVASPVGCWWAADDRFAFSAYSESEFDRPVLFIAEYGGRDGVIPSDCQAALYTDRAVPPGGSVDVTCAFRVTADRSLPHLLAPYKAVYDRRFPLPMYTPDRRGVGMFSEVDQQHVTPSNPLGYHGPACRFDTPRGTAIYVQRNPPMCRRAGFLGEIFWAIGGFRPPMYPPDFDVMPPAVQANIPALVKGFHDQGLRVGLCARAGDGVRRPPGSAPSLYRLSADDPGQMRVLADRFRHAMSMGFDMFYLDSIGGGGMNDLRIIRHIRNAVGPGVLLYSEYCTDLELPYADRYCEWVGDGGIFWTPPEDYAALRLLCPWATWLCNSRTSALVPPSFAKLGLVPLVLDQSLRRLPRVAGDP